MEIPAILISASVVVALASLVLHFLFPPPSDNCPMKPIPPTNTADEEEEKPMRTT